MSGKHGDFEEFALARTPAHAIAYNTTEEKTGSQAAPEPVLTMGELEMVVTNPGWYR